MITSILWLNNLADAVQVARTVNKPIFIDWADLPSCVGCVSLENTTYPDPDVAGYIVEHFVPVQLNQRQNLSSFDESKIIWTPTITICDTQGDEQDRWVGYLPPNQFLPRVVFARARVAISSGDWSEAIEVLNEITFKHGDSLVAAEALYWLGVARWKVSREFDDLDKAWTRLMQEYPGSEAAAKASCLYVF